jgi:hypothetical protein
MFSRSAIDNSRSIIDGFLVMFQLVMSFALVIYDCHIFIVQAIGEGIKLECFRMDNT